MQRYIFSLFLIASLFFQSRLYAQVRTQNGNAEIDIPIFDFQDEKNRISTSVSLRYSSDGGFKVNDIASSIGSGWGLAAGGFIARRQNGEPDDQNSTSLFPVRPNCNVWGFNQDIGWIFDTGFDPTFPDKPSVISYVENYFANGFLYSEFPVEFDDTYPSSCNVPRDISFTPRYQCGWDNRWKHSRRALTDREQDVFVFNFNGNSGEFIIGKDFSITTLVDSKLKIEFATENMLSQNIRTTIKEFTIIDEEGIKYRFNILEKSELTRPNDVSIETGNFSFSRATKTPTGNYIVDKWFLSEIVNPQTNEKIIFQYEDLNIDIVNSSTPVYNIVETEFKESLSLVDERIISKSKRLLSIQSSMGARVDFVYDNVERIDLPGDHRLKRIDIQHGNNLYYSFHLTQKYFYRKEIVDYNHSFSSSEKRFARLCLTALQKKAVAGVEEPPYIFTYHTGVESSDLKDIVPPRNCYAQDFWGHYNKAYNVDIDQEVPSKEILKSLVTNDLSRRSVGENVAILGLLKSVVYPTGGKMIYEFEQHTYKMPNGSTALAPGVRVKKTVLHDGENSTKDVVTEFKYIDENGISSGWGYEPPVYSKTILYTVVKTNGYNCSGVLIADTKEELNTSTTKSMVNAGIQVGIKSYFKGIGFKAPGFMGIIASIILGKIVDNLFLLIDPSDDFSASLYYYFPLTNSNAVEFQYSRVEVQSEELLLGKIVYHFSAPQNMSDRILPNQFPYSAKQRYAPWEFGLPEKTEWFNDANQKVKEIINEYDVIKISLNNIDNRSCKIAANHMLSGRVEYSTNSIPESYISKDVYHPITGQSRLKKTIENVYNSIGEAVTSTTEYSYEISGLQLRSIQKTDSKGNQRGTTIYYSGDYAATLPADPIYLLKLQNRKSVPLTVVSWIKPSGGGLRKLTEASVTEMKALSNNEIVPERLYLSELVEPLSGSIADPGNFDNNNLTNYSFLKAKSLLEYDEYGNNSESIDIEGAKVVSKIYDYNQRFLVAEVTGASRSKIAYTSFESEGKGSWIFDESHIEVNYGYLGEKAFDLNKGTIVSEIVINEPTIVSVWSNGTNPLLNGTIQPTKTGLTVAGWTYYEYLVSGTGGTVTISGSTLIDELRLYPKNARMITYTYDPFLGKTAECDQNNRTAFTEYDKLGRIKAIRDQNRNLIKSFEYHFKH